MEMWYNITVARWDTDCVPPYYITRRQDTDAYKIAEELQKKIDAGQEISNFDLSRQYQANVEAVAQEQQAAEESETPVNNENDGLQLPVLEDNTQNNGSVPMNSNTGNQGEVNSSVQPDASAISLAVMLLEDPILIMKSATVEDSIVIFGEVYTSGGKPVMISVLLNPKSKSGDVLDYAVITSAYGRRSNNLQESPRMRCRQNCSPIT